MHLLVYLEPSLFSSYARCKGCVFDKTFFLQCGDKGAWVWGRHPDDETNAVRTSLLQTLTDVLQTKIANISSLGLEGTVSVIIDSKDVVFIQLQQVSIQALLKAWF